MRMRFSLTQKQSLWPGLSQRAPYRSLATLPARSYELARFMAIRAALGNLLKHSYFITSQMGSQLSRPKLSGTLPIIYVFLARSDKTIHDVSLVGLDQEGEICIRWMRPGFVPSKQRARKSYSPEAMARSVRSITSRRTFPIKAFRTAVS